MTNAEWVSSLRRCADAIERAGLDNPHPVPMFEGDNAVPAIAMLMYLRDLFTGTPREQFNREEILVMIDEVGHDPEIFLPGSWDIIDQIYSEKMES